MKGKLEVGHIKHLTCSKYSPLLLISCLESHNYKKALKIIEMQGNDLNPNLLLKESNQCSIPKTTLELEHIAYSLIGQYLSDCGGVEFRSEPLLSIYFVVLELQKRNYKPTSSSSKHYLRLVKE